MNLPEILQRTRQTASKFPIFGPILLVRIQDLKEASKELTMVFMVSTVPVWLGSLIMLADSTIDRSFMGNMIFNVYGGELYIYTTSLLGPLFYFLIKIYPKNNTFPSKWTFMILALSIIMACSGLFSIIRAREIFGINLDEEFLFTFSFWIYIISWIIVVVAHTYKNNCEDGAADTFKTETNNFVEKYNSRS